jgi:hypothetical protein
VEHPSDSDSSHEDGCESHEHECGDAQTSSHVHSHSLHRPHLPPHDAKTVPRDAPNLTAPPILHSHLQPPPNDLPSGDIPGVPSSRIHTRSVSVATFSSLSPPPIGSTITHSHTVPALAPKARGHRRHSRRAPSLQLHDAARTPNGDGTMFSPVTPGYRFGVDEHFASHQHTYHHNHTPNLHDHSHVHGSGHSREGHSHNMRGLFLHVMAVSSFPFISYLFIFRFADRSLLGWARTGHARLCRGDRFDTSHTILWLDRLRPDRVDFHRCAHCRERDPARHRHWQGARVGRCTTRRWHHASAG